MQYHLDFDFCSIPMLALLFFLYNRKKKLSLHQNTLYTALIIAALFSCTFDIANVMASRHTDSLPFWLLNATSYGYFLFHNSIPFFYSLYTCALIHNDIFHISKKFLSFPIFSNRLFPQK